MHLIPTNKPPLSQVLPPQCLHVNVDSLLCQLLLLLIQLFAELLVVPFPFLAHHLLRGQRLAGAGLRVGVVGRPTGPLLRVLLLAVLGPSVLKPYGDARLLIAKNHFEINLNVFVLHEVSFSLPQTICHRLQEKMIPDLNCMKEWFLNNLNVNCSVKAHR